MSAVRMWRHPNQWLWMSYRFDDGWTEHIALPLADHDELVALLGECVDLAAYHPRLLARLDRALTRLGKGGVK